MNRLRLTFRFCDTEEEAKELVQSINRKSTPYCRKRYPAHYTPWSTIDGSESKFIVWYHV